MGSRSKPLRLTHGAPCKLNINRLLQNRQLGIKYEIGHSDELAYKLYSNIDRYKLQQEEETDKKNESAGIFNLEFSLDGHLLVAACERDCVLIYDASNQKEIHSINNAHDNCVNCVRFLDDKTFATCSDDNTIKLWDIRNLKNQKRTLHAHSNWVKNIEFCEKDNVMVTSAFDGSIYAWDLTNSTDNIMMHDKVFLMSGLMRTKLSPDGSQMIISTTGGYIIIIHDLNLKTLAQDLRTFQPRIYRLMQTSGQNFPAGSICNYLFMPTRRRNRVEFIDDFTFDAEIISSLQIHPHGWNAVSRSMNANESAEVTCVHDIQKREVNEYENAFTYIEEDISTDDTEDANNQQVTDLWMGYISNLQYERRIAFPDVWRNSENSMEIINSGLIGTGTYPEYYQQNPDERNKVVANLPRLTHYIKEKNVGRGFIKELCYSSDGRVICSPYDKGIRILGFNENCQELTYCVPQEPKLLVPLIEMHNYHPGVVVSCKFSPVNMQLVSGCLDGEIVWYKPIL